MTKEEKIVVSAYTGVLMCDFKSVHAYIGEKLGRQIYTHQMTEDSILREIKEETKQDFIDICAKMDNIIHCCDCQKSVVTEVGKRFCNEPLGTYGSCQVNDSDFCSRGRKKECSESEHSIDNIKSDGSALW